MANDGGGGSGFWSPSDWTSAISDIVGSTAGGRERGSSSSTGSARADITGEDRKKLEISQEAIDKIVRDVLAGPEGLASIFAGEQASGIFGSNVAAEASGNLTSKIVGEIAKLRAEEVATTQRTQEQTKETQASTFVDTKEKDGGIFGAIGDLFS